MTERTSGVPPVIFIMECHRTNTDTNINNTQYSEYAECFFKGQGIQGYIYIFNQLPNTNNLQGVSEKSVFNEICILSLGNVSKSDFIPKSS